MCDMPFSGLQKDPFIHRNVLLKTRFASVLTRFPAPDAWGPPGLGFGVRLQR